MKSCLSFGSEYISHNMTRMSVVASQQVLSCVVLVWQMCVAAKTGTIPIDSRGFDLYCTILFSYIHIYMNDISNTLLICTLFFQFLKIAIQNTWV